MTTTPCWPLEQLPDGAEFATAPLLDESNIGKYVWFVWNSNDKQASLNKVVKIGRTNVHVDSNGGPPYSMRVYAPGAASGQTSAGYGLACFTEGHRLGRLQRRDFLDRIQKALRHSDELDLSTLRAAAHLLERSS